MCLNEGCIPSKTLLYSAKLYDGAVNGSKYGINAEKISLDHHAVISRKDKVVKKLVTGIRSKLRNNKVTIIEGEAKVLPKTNEGLAVWSVDKTFTGKRLLIATGSEPVIPGFPGAREGYEAGD